MTVRFLAAVAVLGAVVTAGCGTSPPAPQAAEVSSDGFHATDCNGVTDEDIAATVGTAKFARAVVSDAGCFWQENSMIGTFGAGMGISTWWYRGSDMDSERALEQRSGRTLTELAIDGNQGFKAADANVCSIYVAKQGDVITWSIQSMNPSTLPDLCSVADKLAQLSQDRIN